MPVNRNRELIALNVAWLRQALELVERLGDDTYSCPPARLKSHRVGGHLRHILEFYECFLNGVQSSWVDYDSRKRDDSVAISRLAATARIHHLVHRLKEDSRLREDAVVLVKAEDSPTSRDGARWLPSSIGRELQALSSHTIHHFALIAVTLAAHGVEVDPEFGMSPSTIRFHASRAAATTEAA